MRSLHLPALLSNTDHSQVTLSWVNEGAEAPYMTLEPGDRRCQQTHAGHVWRMRATDGTLLAELCIADDAVQSLVLVPNDVVSVDPSGPSEAGVEPGVELRVHNKTRLEVWLLCARRARACALVCVCVCVDFNRQNLREATGVCPDVGAYRDLCRAAGIARHICVAQAKVCCTL